jgi:hypothetical protein
MSKLVNSVLNKLIPGLPAYKTLIRNEKSYLHSSGWMESKKRNHPCRADGSELPWMNFSIISFLEERLNKDHSLFEYGSGFSTAFYSKLVNTVTSLEHSKEWFDLVIKQLPENANLIFTEEDIDGDYCRSIHKQNRKFDVIIVDGKDRVNCLIQSLNALSHNGVVLLDDSSRSEYKEGIEFFIQNGYRTLNFEGLKPAGNGSTDYSTLFYKSDNCFGI